MNEVGRAALSLVLVLGLAVSCLATGGAAFERMTPEQRKFATEVLASFTPDSTRDQISDVLGEPYRSTPGKLYWRRPGGPDTERVEVYFFNGRIYKIRYSSISPIWGWDLNKDGDRLVPPS